MKKGEFTVIYGKIEACEIYEDIDSVYILTGLRV